jgi:DNA-binding response OmpR family regulator
MNAAPSRILCVDDEPVILELLQALLTAEGYETIPARSGLEALQKLKEKAIDLVILDIKMPPPDGFEVCRQIKGEPGYADIPVIFLTGLKSQEDRIQGIEAGAEDFISKPFDNRELLARVRMLLQRRKIHQRRIGELLVEMHFITEKQLQAALKIAGERKIKVGEALIALGALDKDKIYWVLSNQLKMNYVEPSPDTIDPDLVRQFPVETLEALQCLPLYETAQEIHFAIADPTNPEAVRAVKDLLPSKKAHLHLALPEKIGAILKTLYAESHLRRTPFELHSRAPFPVASIAGKSLENLQKEKQWLKLIEFFFSLADPEVGWLHRDSKECRLIAQRGKDLRTVAQYSEEAFEAIQLRLKRQAGARDRRGNAYLHLQQKNPPSQGLFKINFLGGLGRDLIRVGKIPTFSLEDFHLAEPRTLDQVRRLQQLFHEHRSLLIGGTEPKWVKQHCYALLQAEGMTAQFPPPFFVEEEIEMFFPEVTQLTHSHFHWTHRREDFQRGAPPCLFYEAPGCEHAPEILQALKDRNTILYLPFPSPESMARAMEALGENSLPRPPAVFLRGNEIQVIPGGP